MIKVMFLRVDLQFELEYVWVALTEQKYLTAFKLTRVFKRKMEGKST